MTALNLFVNTQLGSENEAEFSAAVSTAETLLIHSDEQEAIAQFLTTSESHVIGGMALVRKVSKYEIDFDWRSVENCPPYLAERVEQLIQAAQYLIPISRRLYAAAGVARARGDEPGMEDMTDFAARAAFHAFDCVKRATEILDVCGAAAAAAYNLRQAIRGREDSRDWNIQVSANDIWAHQMSK